MPILRRPALSELIVAIALGAAAAASSAAGFGGSASAAVLGQPLNYTVPLRLQASETLGADCVSAEVFVGERKLPAAQVRVGLDQPTPEQARVHVSTTVNIDEPVVGVQISAGCSSVISRRFVLFADPPLQPPAPAAALPQALRPASADVASTSAPGASTQSPPRRSVAAARSTRARPARAATRVAARGVSASAPGAAAPRLRLEAAPEALQPARADAAVMEQAFQAVALAASAAREAASAASAAQQRVASLEQELLELRADAKTSRDLNAIMRDRLQRAQEASRWTWPLITLLLLMLLVLLWLLQRVMALQRERDAGWRAAAAEAGAIPAPAVAADLAVLTQALSTRAPEPAATEPEGRPVAADAWNTQPMTGRPAAVMQPPLLSNVVTEAPAPQRTDVFPVPGRAEEQLPRDVSIEELIDLEQQADFFVVLGQDEAAVDLLVEHLRQTGGSSPLPYLKLLEIYRRRNDHANYERLRVRFNQRFNAYAPDWGVDLASGRTLEDYGGVLPRLQLAWSRPMDAMAELEALLFRKSRGELFDLPAYREVLFLYALARDLLDREAADTGTVDLLLPLGEPPSTEFGATAPGAFITAERPTGRERDTAQEERPTQPVDLDLSSELERPTSIFDPVTEPEPRPRRR